MATEGAAWSIEPLAPTHRREGFDCGDSGLNEFLRKYARQNEARRVVRTYVAVARGASNVVGYFTLRFGHVAYEQFPAGELRRVPRYPVPVMHPGRLAVDLSVRGMGLGRDLLLMAFAKTLRASEIAGLFAVEVVAKDDRARQFYLKYGFKELLDDPKHLYLGMSDVVAVLG